MTGNPFVGLSIAQLLPIQEQALIEVTLGKTIVGTSGVGQQVTSEVSMPAADRLRYASECLMRLDPTKYGSLQSQTIASFP